MGGSDDPSDFNIRPCAAPVQLLVKEARQEIGVNNNLNL